MDRDSLRRERVLMKMLDRLPADGPFTSAHALRCGVSYAALRALVRDGLLAHPMRGAYHATHLDDSMDLRISVLVLLTPRHAVVTDRSAAYLWGAKRVLAPGAHLEVPPVSMFCLPGSRLRNKLVDSGQRMLTARDIEVVGELKVTTPLRTACDVGRLLHRDQAIGVMDALASLRRFSVPQLVVEAERFKGFRGVRQLRELAPLVDPESGSPGEGTVRLRWIDLELPKPRCQVEVPAPGGRSFFIDVGSAASRFGAEYFGDEFHGPDEEDHDEARLAWLRDELGWVIVVIRGHNAYGPEQDLDVLLVEGAREAGLLPPRR